MTTQYRVIWEIDLDAKSPKDAARKALAIQRDPASIATLFEVVTPQGCHSWIDLKPEDLRTSKAYR